MSRCTLLFFISVLMCFCAISYGQDNEFIDSIKQIIPAQDDTNKLESYHQLLWYYQYNHRDSALKYANTALELAEKMNYQKGKATALANIGVVYESFGEYRDAMDFTMKSLKIHEQLHNQKGICICLSSIGNIYYYQNNFDKTLEYWNNALTIAKELNDTGTEMSLLNNMALVYSEQGMHEKSLQQNLKCLEFQKKITGYDFSSSYLNIGKNYFDLGMGEKALENYLLSIDLARQSKNISVEIAALANAGEIYMENGELDKAKIYCKLGIALAQEGDLKRDLKDTYKMLSNVYYRAGNYKEAFETHQLYVEVKDTLLNQNNQKAIAELNTKYETEKKEKENQILKQNNEISELQINRQRITIYAGAGGLTLMVLLAIVIFRSYAQKKKAHQLLEHKNLQLEEKNMIIEEKNQDITDSINYASNIQQAILPDPELIKKTIPEHFIYFQPRDIVSGDFFWFHEKNDKIFIMAADCTGHGVPGAFVSMLCNNVLNHVVVEKDMNDPGEILSDVSRRVSRAFKKEGAKTQANDGMDCSLCVFEKSMQTLHWAGANNPLFLVRSGELMETKADKTPIGGSTESDYAFTTNTLEIQKGDLLYIFSDGYADQFGGETGKKFMIKNFKKMLTQISASTCTSQFDFIHKTLVEWKGEEEQIDDILVIGIKV